MKWFKQIKDYYNPLGIKCKVCKYSYLPENERLRVTEICFNCAGKIIPNHIPQEQHIRYLKRIYGYEMQTL